MKNFFNNAGLLVLTVFVIAFTSAEEEQLPPLTSVHAHNDYNHKRPLFDALDHGFASVEADIILVDGQLFVGHDRKNIKPERTLQSLYLDPLRARAKKFGGRIYPHGDGVFYLLIDTKTDANATYAVLEKVLQDYADLITEFKGANIDQKAVTVVLTGNRPRGPLPKEPVRLAALDAQMPDLDKPNVNGVFVWFSENWKDFYHWNGEGPMPEDEQASLKNVVTRAHERHLKVRFWNSPHSTNFWGELRRDGVDLLNVDDLAGAETFLRPKSDSPAKQ